ncbi:MAG: cyclase family protein [Eubacteriales bacterium]|nr:cyclase family protein [Eubacteriales bacterium]
MKVIDLTHFISEDMPVYPGTEPPILAPANTYEKDGFKETLMTMYTHTGTHMDPPAHLYAGRTTLDSFPVDQFVGKALVIDCRDLKEGDRIGIDRINAVKEKADAADFLLFMNGWDRRWGTDDYFKDYPYIDDEVVDYIIAQKKKGVGLDVIGIDPIADENLTIHKKLFKNNEIVVIENLENLDLCGEDLFTFIALPLKHVNGDGSPIRAIALWE